LATAPSVPASALKAEGWGRKARTSPNLWTDANLAAFADCAGLRLATFDHGFSRFKGLEYLILKPLISNFCFLLRNGYAFLRRTRIALAPKQQQRLRLGVSGVA
jgi:hypothetical protein